MEAIHQEVTLSRRRGELKIVMMGCVHYGARGCDEDLVDFWLRKILKERDTYVVVGGDMIDAISEKDPRYTQQEVAGLSWGDCRCCKRGGDIITRQSIHVQNKLRPLAKAGKILWWHEGNHEEKVYTRMAGPDLTREWCYQLGVPYAARTALAWLSIVVPHGKKSGHRCAVRFLSTHGSGTAATSGAAINKVNKLLNDYKVDVACAWHWHRRATDGGKRRLGLVQPRGGMVRIKTYDQVGVACGTFMNSHTCGVTGYGERAGYSPVVLGPAVLHIRPEVGGDKNESVRIWPSVAVVEAGDVGG